MRHTLAAVAAVALIAGSGLPAQATPGKCVVECVGADGKPTGQRVVKDLTQVRLFIASDMCHAFGVAAAKAECGGDAKLSFGACRMTMEGGRQVSSKGCR